MKDIRVTFSTTMPFSSMRAYTGSMEKWHASMVFSGYVQLANTLNCYESSQ
jgi:hypothetical protein